MCSSQDIQSSLNELILKKNKEERFYHYRSLQNFIHFFDDLGSIQLKKQVYSILIEYLEIVKSEPIEDIHQCTTLFDEYIRPVGHLYEKSLGFMPIMSFWVMAFWFIFLFGIIYVFNLPIISYYIIGILFLGYYFYCLKKRMDKKVYGLKW